LPLALAVDDVELGGAVVFADLDDVPGAGGHKVGDLPEVLGDGGLPRLPTQGG
jgi:hypothetical protein